MGSNFSVWLRETARLYLRYGAVGVASIPFALAWAWAARVGWNPKAAFPILAMLTLAVASAVWRRMGNWQIASAVKVRPFEADYAELLKVTLQRGAALQYRETVDEDMLRVWNNVLGPTFVNDEDLVVVETFMNLRSKESPITMLTWDPVLGLQEQLLTEQKAKRSQERARPDEPSEAGPRIPPAFSLRRGPSAGLAGLA